MVYREQEDRSGSGSPPEAAQEALGLGDFAPYRTIEWICRLNASVGKVGEAVKDRWRHLDMVVIATRCFLDVEKMLQ